MFHRILVAIDHSQISRSVFETALNLAKVMDARLMLLHVLSLDERPVLNLPMDFPVYSPMLTDEVIKRYQEEWTASEQKGIDTLQALTNEAIAAGVPTEFTQNLGDPSRTICELAQNQESDLIVIGRRGHSGWQEVLLGSVSNYVLHYAPCSVLAVQGQDQPEAEANAVSAVDASDRVPG